MSGGNLELWERVAKTDPSFTKPVRYGRKFTAIDPQYQLREATRMWGPYGSTWGLRRLQWDAFEIPGHHETVDDGQGNKKVVEVDAQLELSLDAEFFVDSSSFKCVFPIAVSMKFKVGDDCKTKLLTHARSKALSYLGFNADVYLGQFDDNKYVQEVGAEFETQKEIRAKAMTAFKVARDAERIEFLWSKTEERFGEGQIDQSTFDDLQAAAEAARKRVAAKQGRGDED